MSNQEVNDMQRRIVNGLSQNTQVLANMARDRMARTLGRINYPVVWYDVDGKIREHPGCGIELNPQGVCHIFIDLKHGLGAPNPEHTLCTICYEPYDEEKRTLTHVWCNSTWCEACLLPWIQKHNTCPICRDSPQKHIISRAIVQEAAATREVRERGTRIPRVRLRFNPPQPRPQAENSGPGVTSIDFASGLRQANHGPEATETQENQEIEAIPHIQRGPPPPPPTLSETFMGSFPAASARIQRSQNTSELSVVNQSPARFLREGTSRRSYTISFDSAFAQWIEMFPLLLTRRGVELTIYYRTEHDDEADRIDAAGGLI